jgi:O-antigen/teichoic acid export membrane protein
MARNVGWLFLDKVVRMGLGLLISVWIARYLGPEQFGLLSFSTALVGLFGAVAALGLQGIVVRDVARQPNGQETTLATSALIQLITGGVSYALLLAVIFWLRPDDPLARTVVAILGAAMLLKVSDVAAYWFESQVTSKYVVLVQNGTFLLFLAVKAYLIVSHAPLVAFAWAICAEAVLAAVILLLVFKLRGPKLSLRDAHLERAKTLLKDSWPLVLSAVAVALAMRIDQVMIGQMLGDLSVGYYAAAARLAEMFAFVGLIIAQSAFPRLVQLSGSEFGRAYIRLLRYPFYLILAIAVMMSLTSQHWISPLWGVAYADAAPALSVLAFSIPATFVSTLSSRYLLKHGFQKEILFRQSLGLVVNVGLNLAMIPRYGIVGAAVATVITDVIIAFGCDIGRKRFKGLLLLKMQALFFAAPRSA